MLIDNIFRKLYYKIDMCTTQSSGIISYDLADFKEKSNHENSGSRETLDPENGVCSAVFLWIQSFGPIPVEFPHSTGKKSPPNGLLYKNMNSKVSMLAALMFTYTEEVIQNKTHQIYCHVQY